MLITLMASLIFSAVSIVVLASGVFTLQSNHKASSNRAFFALTVAVAVWSSGMALSAVAPDASICEIFRRFATVGWSTAYAVLLHFILIITGKASLFKKRRLYILLYLPALFCLYAFVIPNALNPFPYNLKQTRFGWINVAQNNIWDLLFYAYYIGFTLIGLFLLYRWGKNSSDNNIKKKSRIILLSLTAALVLGTITDVVLNSLFSELPQMAPVIMLIPNLAIYHVLQKDSFGIKDSVDKKNKIYGAVYKRFCLHNSFRPADISFQQQLCCRLHRF